MATDVTTYVSREEYLANERAAIGSKSEWVDGEVVEMVGASRKHNVAGLNIGHRLLALLDRTRFDVYVNDMKVRVPDGPYRYPDVVVAPGRPRFEDEHEDVLLDPLVLFEVLSPTTEAIDRGEKLDEYGRIPSLTDYLLVAQDAVRVDHYRRAEGITWEVTIFKAEDAAIRLPSIDCELPLRDVYHRVLD